MYEDFSISRAEGIVDRMGEMGDKKVDLLNGNNVSGSESSLCDLGESWCRVLLQIAASSSPILELPPLSDLAEESP